MVDIFSSFDPATNSIFSYHPLLFWLLSFSTLALFHPFFWVTPNRVSGTANLISSTMAEQSSRTYMAQLKGFPSILSALFILVIATNLMGTIPYVFSFSSHLLFSLSLGAPIWASMIFSAVAKSPSYTAANLLPAGAPSWLNPFLILVETLSMLVRPITLCFRLTANMSAGHVVIGLVGTYLSTAILTSNMTSILSLLAIQTGYTMFEFGVSLIQAYIFCLLLSLYSDDHPM